MPEITLTHAVIKLAKLTCDFNEADLEKPWAWGPHEEGIRFALIGTYHELRELAVTLATARSQAGPSVMAVQRILSQYLAAYYDLQAILVGVPLALYEKEPAPEEWPLRVVLGHITNTQRRFFTLVHYGLARQQNDSGQPEELLEGETERVTGPDAVIYDIINNQPIPDLLAYYEDLHERTLSEFVDITDTELDGRSLWWEKIPFTLHHRLHRFDAHLRQHTIQVEKTLTAVGHPLNESRQWLRLIYNALAQVEGILLGTPDLGTAVRKDMAQTILARTQEIATI